MHLRLLRLIRVTIHRPEAILFCYLKQSKRRYNDGDVFVTLYRQTFALNLFTRMLALGLHRLCVAMRAS